MRFPTKLHFRAENCTFYRKNACSCRKCGFRGADSMKPQEIVGGFRGRTLQERKVRLILVDSSIPCFLGQLRTSRFCQGKGGGGEWGSSVAIGQRGVFETWRFPNSPSLLQFPFGRTFLHCSMYFLELIAALHFMICTAKKTQLKSFALHYMIVTATPLGCTPLLVCTTLH